MGFLRPLNLRFTFGTEHVRTVVRNFFPVFLSRGVVQISAYVDSFLASYLPTGAVSALAYAQTLNTLPVSLFGMAISAAELPAMSSALGTQEEIGAALRRRLELGLQNIAFFVVPSAVAFLVLGDVVVATIYRGGHFTAHDVNFVWSVLAGSAVGLLASTSGRLYSSAFYALRDTRTPLNFAIIRVVLTVVMGYLFALPLPKLLGIDRQLGRRGAHAFSGNRRVGGVFLAATRSSGAHRRRRAAALPGCTALGGSARSGCCCLWGQAGAAIPLSAADWVVRAFDVWGGVFVVHQDAGGCSSG